MVERPKRDRSRSTRNRRLKLHPVCAHCAARGLVRPTDIIDHVVPLALGGPDTDENTQGLCNLCNAIKTASESPSAAGALNHPDWLQPALGKLSIVCGPPCSGKTTLVRSHAAEGDVVIDFDDILDRLSPGFRPWHDALEPATFNRAIRVRNAMLGSLARPPGRRAWFVIGAPSPREQQWWRSQLGGDLVVLRVDRAECERRAIARGTPAAIPAIARWFDESVQPWSAGRKKLSRVAFDVDGYPIEE